MPDPHVRDAKLALVENAGKQYRRANNNT